jgi:hypothetical protein
MNKTPDTIQQRALETWYYKDHELHQNLLPSVMGISGEARRTRRCIILCGNPGASTGHHTRRTITVESRQAHGEGRKWDGIQ